MCGKTMKKKMQLNIDEKLDSLPLYKDFTLSGFSNNQAEKLVESIQQIHEKITLIDLQIKELKQKITNHTLDISHQLQIQKRDISINTGYIIFTAITFAISLIRFLEHY